MRTQALYRVKLKGLRLDSRRGGIARRQPAVTSSKAFHAFAEEVLADEKVRQRILADARAGRLPAGVVSNLIAVIAGRPVQRDPARR